MERTKIERGKGIKGDIDLTDTNWERDTYLLHSWLPPKYRSDIQTIEKPEKKETAIRYKEIGSRDEGGDL